MCKKSHPLPVAGKVYPRAPKDRTQRQHQQYYTTRQGNVSMWNATSNRFINVVAARLRDVDGSRPRDQPGTLQHEGKLKRKQRYRDDPNNKRRKQQVRMKTTYGLSPSAYLNLFLRQGFACALCQRFVKMYTRTAHIDHCHKTGKVRGILCLRCNTALGNVEIGGVGWGQRADKYLAQFAVRSTSSSPSAPPTASTS